MDRKRVVIMGAAGRDFHDFNVVYRNDPGVEVVAFTATQIPGIADRRYPPELAGPLYDEGIPIVPESEIERVIRDESVDLVVFAYSDVSHETVMHAASRVLAAGVDFTLLGPDRTMLNSRRPVLAVGGTRTGAGKSQTTRYLAALLAERGIRPVVVRHPMPYGDLVAQRVQRYATYDDLDRYETTIEEREEYEPHLDAGRVVYAGVDYEAILHEAEIEADVILWDGGNNDFPFYRPDLYVVVADPLRPGDERRYHPGETDVRMADVVIINKIDSAEPGAIEAVRATIEKLNPTAEIVTARSDLTLVGPSISGKRVVVVEDGPTLTHGGMLYGAGVVAVRRFGAARLVDPRPAAVGSIREVLDRYPALEPLVPAVGYGPAQIGELETTLNAVDADLVLSATPIDLTRLLDELQLGRGETIADTAHALSLYLDALRVRTFAQASVEELAANASIPVVNALTNEHHPCQALADVLTLEEEFGTLAGIQVAFVGDGDNVCHSLIQAAGLAGFELRVATPSGYEPSEAIVAGAQMRGLITGGSIILTHDPAEAVFGAEAVYADVWTSTGKEAEQASRKAAFTGFTVDAKLMERASRTAIFLHCLPPTAVRRSPTT